MADKDDDLQQIYDSVDELMDLIFKVVGYTLPEDYQRPNENGDDAFARLLIQPLNEVQCLMLDLMRE